MTLEAKDVIERLCKLTEEVHDHVGSSHASDCFCGKGGFWGSGTYDGTFANGYRNDGACLDFIEAAVREKLRAAQETAVAPKRGEQCQCDTDDPFKCFARMDGEACHCVCHGL